MVDRARKLFGASPGDGEHEALQKVSRSCRGEEEAVGDQELEEARRRVAAFRALIADRNAAPFNVLKGFRELLGLSPFQMASETRYSLSRYYAIEAGAMQAVPSSISALADQIMGSGAGADLQSAWTRFRAAMSAEVRKEIERRLFPSGIPGHMAP